jgi:hypothetical protein
LTYQLFNTIYVSITFTCKIQVFNRYQLWDFMMTRFAGVVRTINARLIFKLSILAIFLLAGCGGSGNIPVASVLSSGRITLSWNDVSGAASYEIYMSTSPGVTTLNSYKISDVTSPITITDLEPGTTYYFMIAVFSDSGESRKSKEVSFTVSDTEGFIDFGDLIGPSEPENKSPPTVKSPVSSSAEAQRAMKKAAPGARAAARDKALGPAVKTGQTASKQSTKSATKKPTMTDSQKTPTATQKKAPVAKKKSSQTVVSSKADTRDVTLAWDDVPGATSYNIYWRDKSGVTRQNGTKIGNVKNPHKLKGLTKGKRYYFVVTAVNQSGESSESAEFSFTVGE